MVVYLTYEEDGTVTGSSAEEREGYEAVEAPDGFDLATVRDYVVRDGALAYTGAATDALLAQEADVAARAARDAQLAAFAALALAPMAADMTDDDALSVSTLWHEWSGDGVGYAVGQVVRLGNALYRCAQAHTSQPTWSPDAAPSLWSRVDVAGDGTEVWTQPTGAHDAYGVGDRVHYPGASSPVYESVIAGNVWSPDAYPAGWRLVDGQTEPEPDPEPDPEPEPEPDPEPEPEPDAPEFVQPTGAHDAYSKGDRVTYGGKVYESLIDGNVWSPDAYPQGWELVDGS